MSAFARSARRGTAALALALVAAACGAEDGAAGDVGPDAPDVASVEGEAPVEEPIDDRPRSPFTGMPTEPEVLERAALLVKVDNAPLARPQSGLDAAAIVFEEQVEGGMTRFMALMHGDLPDVVGPVRSARPVDVDLLSGFGASGFAYSGARAEVQGMLASVPSVRVVEGVAGFFRDDERPGTHDLFIETETVLDVVEGRGARPLVDIGWEFDEVAPDGALTCPSSAPDCPDPGASVVIEFSISYRTGWTYDATAGVYRREQNGRPFLTVGPDEIGAANVVVLATRHYVGASGYEETDGTTEGAPAIVLRDGRRYEARWEKPTSSDLLLLRTPEGEPFPLKPGATWLHLPAAERMPTVG